MKLVFTLSTLLFAFTSSGQINKGQILVGGTGNYSAFTYRHTDMKFRGYEIDGRSGVFLVNKLAIGLLLGYQYDKEFGTSLPGNQYFRQYDRRISAGPFLRYYFLSANNKINFLADASYFRNWSKSGNLGGGGKWNSYGYAFAAGPVFFLSPNVSLETTLNYEDDQEWVAAKVFKVKVGFQVHLTRNKIVRKQTTLD
ncbi:MAG: hypothetical protein ACXWC7_02650 [Chitinophagaceae bacterium]